MTPTQEHLFKLLLEIDDICTRNGIEYFLEYGTALGAVRHEGFIPWDNDLDISMTEPNYDKFKEACQRELDHVTRTFCDNRMNREFPTVFGHYIDLECCRMTQRTPFWDNYVGQTIDVFCYVALPKDIEQNKRISTLYYAYDEYVNELFPHYLRKTEDIYKTYLDMCKRGREVGKEAVIRQAEEQIFGQDHEDAEWLMCTSARMNWSVFYPKRAFDNLKKVPFEGHTFNIPGDWYEIMADHYGDDFALFPPESKYRIHTEMSHSNVPSKAYVDDFTRVVDVKKMLDNRLRYKNYGMENGYRANELTTEFYQMTGTMVKRHIQRRIEDEGIQVEELLDKGDLESVAVLKDLLAEYISKQMHSSMFYWRVHIGCSDSIDCAAMYVRLVDACDVKSIDRLVAVRIFNGLEIPERMQRIQAAAHHVRDIKKYFHYGDLAKAREHADWALANLPEIRQVRVWDYVLRVAEADSANDLEACAAAGEELAHAYPKDDILEKAHADLLWKLGERGRAWELYDALAERTNNGFILLDIRKRRESEAGNPKPLSPTRRKAETSD